MLAGVRTGKKRKRASAKATEAPKYAPTSSSADDFVRRSATARDDDGQKCERDSVPATRKNRSENMSAAAELRRNLLAMASSIPSSGPATEKSFGRGRVVGAETAVDRLERRGRIGPAAPPKEGGGQEQGEDVLVLTGASGGGRAPYQREDFRHGSRKGKLRPQEGGATGSSTSGGSISQMVAEERQSSMSMDELYARNVSRLGSRYRGTDFAVGAGASAGADEEDEVDMKMFESQKERLTGRAAEERDRSRQIARADAESVVTAKCWWWMESKSFRRHMLLSLGDHVSLVLVPSHLALTAGHCYLVPVKHAESFRACEDEVWDEVRRFQTSLRAMFAKKGGKNQGALFCETVLPSKKGLWQARMDVVPVPRRVEQDAEIYFKSALTEQAEEWGTHNKLLSTRDKGLCRTVPKSFPYFHIEWEGGGYAQIIESQSFPKDFGLDTIAGMMEIDPIKFNRKRKASDEDRGAVLEFCEKWKEFDWTLELDGGEVDSKQTKQA